jgi:hypothetical protein
MSEEVDAARLVASPLVTEPNTVIERGLMATFEGVRL